MQHENKLKQIQSQQVDSACLLEKADKICKQLTILELSALKEEHILLSDKVKEFLKQLANDKVLAKAKEEAFLSELGVRHLSSLK